MEKTETEDEKDDKKEEQEEEEEEEEEELLVRKQAKNWVAGPRIMGGGEGVKHLGFWFSWG